MLQNQTDQLMAGGKEPANAMALMNDFLKDNNIGGPKMAKGAGFAKNRMQSGRKPPSMAAETPMQQKILNRNQFDLPNQPAQVQLGPNQ